MDVRPSRVGRSSLRDVKRSSVCGVPRCVIHPSGKRSVRLPLLCGACPFFRDSACCRPRVDFRAPKLVSSPGPCVMEGSSSVATLLLTYLVVAVLMVSFKGGVVGRHARAFFSDHLGGSDLPAVGATDREECGLLLRLRTKVLTNFFFFGCARAGASFFVVSISPRALLTVCDVVY